MRFSLLRLVVPVFRIYVAGREVLLKRLKEPLLAWGAAILALRVIESLSLTGALGNQAAGLATAVILLYLPIGIHLKKKEKVDYFDRAPGDFGRSLVVFFLFSLSVFPPALLVNHLYQVYAVGLSYQNGAMASPLGLFFTQLMLIALPEEFFFRGYLQGRFNSVFEKRRNLLGVPVGAGLFWVSLIFAVSHSLIAFAPWHILIFFPALAFGWLREKTGTIIAPILFHASCNLFSRWVDIHYF